MSLEPTQESAPSSADLPSPSTGSSPAKCQALTRDGRPCPVKPVLGLPHCYAHSPELAEERHMVRVRGGLEATRQRFLASDRPRPRLDNPAAMRETLEELIHAVTTGALAPAAANSAFYGIATALRLEELTLSAQVAAMEQELARRRAGR